MAITVKGAVVVDDDPGGAEPVTFGYRGVIYQVDLEPDERHALGAIFARYIDLAERTGTASGNDDREPPQDETAPSI